ncbi:2,3,4,5-tetrahydropyridine-2,6-dicarboxylate N-succinyltransferase [Candidatus Bealeia paramacronuclearis]|uniref:2,3,4,5-tetrahydropyridine-2,6-dicarboxylate N-succinyltransferase n=1 Tax=Candidatus Bealeia paramacronuclearis TaxID=1921001 RepID=A0ABZ2C346_9PROT|nr:2,3,4,5-tetrahydropyridine-2,6-dicarboxylate N-succinyltransferase [Candidatus Bealeia paramacronuclearis]
MFSAYNHLKEIIESAWEKRAELSPESKGEIPEAIRETMFELDCGDLRVATKNTGCWIVHDWIKKAILLSFRVHNNFLISDGNSKAFDKIPLKFENWGDLQFREAGIRVVPGAIVRHSAYLAPSTILMPSFINVGAYVGQGTLVDSGVRIGSCAQIGMNCHLSDNVGIGGVLEPLQAQPVIIEDHCFLGACVEVVEGVLVEKGSVLGAGVILTSSTKIIDRQTGEISYGRVPSYSVVVPGTIADQKHGIALNCAVIVKRVDEKTRAKTSLNELLRP